MPIPVTTNAGKIMRHLKRHHSGWSRSQKYAVLMNQLRKAGKYIPEKKKKVYKRKR